jgi:hypothetical protein
MKAEEFSKGILSLDPKMRFAGLIEKSGHLFAGGEREGLEEHLKGRDAELSLSQSAFIVTMRNVFSPELGNLKYVVYAHEKVKLFSIPLMEYICIFCRKLRKRSRYTKEDFGLYKISWTSVDITPTL